MKKFGLLLLLIFLVACQNAPLNQEDKGTVDGTFEAGSYKMLGDKGRIGFIESTFYAGKDQKYMWHFWGESSELDGSLLVKATHEKTGQEKKVLQVDALSGPNNTADAHIPSLMSLPESGIWLLDAYIGGDYFGTVTVKVYE
ncbi:hypothetical protein [Halobacillus sp. H74]|uniref:hypothetical protein n=1 Tax=Halobacillus sp. H74 TaxID=3457436 RepID=UPI003FCD2EA0